MLKALVWIEFFISAGLIASIMLQHRGTGLGGVFASGSNVYRSKRGIEKFLFNSTITLAVTLCVAVLIHLFFTLKVQG